MSSSASNAHLLGEKLLSGRTFFIGTLPWVFITFTLSPYMLYSNNSIGSNGYINGIDGFVHQIVLYLAFKYNFKFHYISSRDGAFGSLVNGSWNGLVGMLYRGEIDLIAADLSVTYPRSQVVEFTVQFEDDDSALLIPYPELETIGTVNGITRPFQYEVWILIVVSLVAVTIILWKLLAFESPILNKKTIKNQQFSLARSFLALFEIQIIVNPRTPVRILLYVWCLVTIVLVNAYSSTLTSCLMTPRYHTMVNSVDDIAKIDRPVYMVTKYSSNEAAVLNATFGVMAKIGDSLRKYPELRLPSATAHEDAIEYITTYRDRTFATEKSVLLSMVEQDFKNTGQCRLYLAKKPWGIARQAFALPKSSDINLIFNHEINWVRQVGLLDYWHRMFWPRLNRCSEPLTTKINSQTRLSLSHVSSVFLLLGVGLTASLLIFLLELIAMRASYHRQTDRSLAQIIS